MIIQLSIAELANVRLAQPMRLGPNHNNRSSLPSLLREKRVMDTGTLVGVESMNTSRYMATSFAA